MKTKTNNPDLSNCTVADLCVALRNRPEVIAVQVWDVNDIFSEANENLDFGEEDAQKIADSYKGKTIDKASLKEALEDCSDGWNLIDDAIFDTANRLGLGEPRH